MRVEIIKVHPSWNVLYPNEFNVGDVVELENKKVKTKSGLIFLADEMCKSFGCSYSDIFKKIE